jgi:hypothetical protein
MITFGSAVDANAAKKVELDGQRLVFHAGFFLARPKLFLLFNHSLELTMTKSVLFAALLAAVALTACGKKEEVAAPAAAPATEAAAPAAPAAAPAAPADAPAAPADAAAPAKQ